MPKKRSDQAGAIAPTFAALGAPSRLRMLRALRDAGELCVGDLVVRLQVWQSTVSHQLVQLSMRGLVVSRRQGKRKFYRLKPAGFRAAASFLASLAGRAPARPKGVRES